MFKRVIRTIGLKTVDLGRWMAACWTNHAEACFIALLILFVTGMAVFLYFFGGVR